MPPSDRLKAIRQHIVNDAEGFGKMLKNRGLKAEYSGLSEESKLSRPPKGFSEDLPHLEQIKLKNFIVWNAVPTKGMLPEQLEEIVLKGFKAAYPLAAWLRSVPLAEEV
jgi:uncharacterized protein (DUF2461 family)